MPELHHDAVVVDCHNDLILLVDRRRALGDPADFRERVIPSLRAGGVDVQVVPIFMEAEYAAEGALRRALQLIEWVHREAEANPDAVALCRSGAEIDAATAEGKIALVLALEGCEAIGKQTELLGTFFRLGVRIASFTHFGRTLLADGSGEDDTGGRLTRAGAAAVREMERLGILVDVSHLSIAGTQHVLELATRPVIASHSSARALLDHHRNLSDDVLRRIAATGGVIGANFFPAFVAAGRPTIDHVVDHLQHLAAVAGWDHVGIGPDFIKEYYDERYPHHPSLKIEGLDAMITIEGLTGPQDLPALTAALLRRGVSEANVRKVLGENFLRVFRSVLGVPGSGRG
ncbi:MAG TPA: dipeptidase [bacterium]|nr:dipeptidase [bacterium]